MILPYLTNPKNVTKCFVVNGNKIELDYSIKF